MTKVALITGCSEPDSLGAALAVDLHRRGYRVIATARKVATMDQLAASGIDVLALDVSSPESISNVVDSVTANAGRLDVLINNAALGGHGPLLDTDLNVARSMFEVNFWGPIILIQSFSKLLARTALESGEQSVIVNIGSVGSYANPWLGIYAASKAGLQTMSDTLRMELAPHNISVITVVLGGVRTAMTASGSKAVTMVVDGKGSGLYDNFSSDIGPAIVKTNAELLDKMPTAAAVAKQIGAAVSRSRPPGKIWVGWMSAVFSWIGPLLPIRVFDSIMSRMGHIDMVIPKVK